MKSIGVREVMQSEVHTVAPSLGLAELERAFLEQRVTGFPVVSGDKLVGIVARSDIVRALNVERSIAEYVSDFYGDTIPAGREAGSPDVGATGAAIGARLEGQTVADVMIRDVVTVSADQSLQDVSRVLTKRRIHRLPVTEDGRLVGIVSTLDLVGLIAEGVLRSA